VEPGAQSCAAMASVARGKLRVVRAIYAALGALALAAALLPAPARAEPIDDRWDRHPGLWEMSRTGEFRPFTEQRTDWSAPVFSPDGRRIAAFSGRLDREGYLHAGVVMLSPHGRLLHKFPTTTWELGSISWSPDGDRIAYGIFRSVDYDDNVYRATYLTDTPGGGHPHDLTHYGHGYGWGPRGRVGLVEIRGNDGRVLTMSQTGSGRHTLAHRALYLFDWSRDGHTLVYQHGDPPAKFDEESYDVWTVRDDGRKPRRLVKDLYGYYGLSPDGKWLLFSREEAAGTESIWVVRLDGTGERRLLAGEDQPSFDWVPGSNHTAFTVGKTIEPGQKWDKHLYTWAMDGSERDLGRIGSGPVAWSPDGRVIAWVDNGERMGLFRVASRKRTVIARFRDILEFFSMTWSPDSKRMLFEPHQDFPD
jgi:Tol biopolymer transport system component